MPSHCTIETANHGRPHFHLRPRAIVRATLIFVLVTAACADVLGAYYVRQEQTALRRRVQDVAIRFVQPPLTSPLAKLD